MKCKNLTTGQVVLIRAYGKKSELIIDRQAELIVNLSNFLFRYFIFIHRLLQLYKVTVWLHLCIVVSKTDLFMGTFQESL